MPLADTSRAIGAVTEALKERLESPSRGTGKPVSVGRLDQSGGSGEHLNLFLYEIIFDPHLKNTPLNEGEKPPSWLVLKYLLTAFESTTDSDSPDAQKLLGAAIRAIQQDDLLKLDGLAADTDPLTPNPSELFVTFDESPSDLVARLSQGSDETPRLSIAFQVRPVMIASGEPGDYSLLVGVDYSLPPTALQKDYVGLDVIPTMGPVIDRVEPKGFELGEEVSIFGTDMHIANLSVLLGSVELPVTMQQPDQLKFKIDETVITSSGISAGSFPVTVAMTLSGTGKIRKSNAVMGNLVPTVSVAFPNIPPPAIPAANTVTTIAAVPPPPAIPTIPKKAHARIDISGKLLGKDTDDVIVAFYRNGKVEKMFDALTFPNAPDQTALRFTIAAADAVTAGNHNLIVIVNGQQAPQSPIVRMDNP
ncbi:MAG: DUF4255 domain-containing protein [Pyrinomonadaceae bacterium]